MRLDRLEVEGWRNYEALAAEFVPGVNLIVGDNAQGKTNLLEAISYLSMARSFRTRREQELIRMGADFADLRASIQSHGREQTLRAVLFAGRKPRQLYLGGVKQRTAAELSGVFTTVLFCPEDLMTLKAGPAARRKLLDNALCQLRPGYDRALSEYGKLHEHKSRILRDHYEHPGLLEALPEFNLRMAQVGAVLISYRARYLDKLAELTAQYHQAFSGGREALCLRYQTVSNIPDPKAPQQELLQRLMEHQHSHQRAELESGQCLSGPHKDDFDVTLDGVSLKGYGSQGQIRTAAISLKLAEREIFRQDTGEAPILLLDDVLSELDPARQDFVLNQIQTGQVFITCCERGRLTELGRAYTIEQGRMV